MVRLCLLLVLAASAALGAAPFLRPETPTTATQRHGLDGHATAATTTPTQQESPRGRERKMAKILVPLILGFKLAGVIVMGVALVKLFLVKALILSKVALLSAAFLLAKKLLSSLGTHQQHHPYLFAQQPIYHQEQLPYAQYPEPVHGYGYSAAGVAALGGGVHEHVDDQHAHFSEQVPSAVLQPNYNNTARNDDTTTTTSSTSTAQHRNRITMVKSFTNRAPVLAYRKVVSTGRQASSL